MKKIFLSLGAFMVLSTPAVLAQEQEMIATHGNSVEKLEKVDKANTCYFDSQYKQMKHQIGIKCEQEKVIDCLYEQYKRRLESLRDRKNCEQQKLCSMIENCASNSEIRAQKRVVKNIYKDMKEELKGFRRDVKEQLNKDQYGSFRRFNWHEGWKMRKMAKNCQIYVFPCIDKMPCSNRCNSR